MEIEQLVSHCVDKGYRLHRDLGPGLLENVYEALLYESLRRDGLNVLRQGAVSVEHEGVVIENGFRFDLLVEDKLIIEIKSTERHAPVHAKQVLTYLRLMDLRIGLLMNFGMSTFKDGCQRLVNNYERGKQ
ncbi:MAG: GxxExxY protein [Sphingomonadaceae bacterium]|nr:GxxExxY protein [Sphingomonadaceae bacterium]MCP5383833.1 GxxExxY protein [Altererythrobacter sp.]MCP5392170.1 GxxExxY protein [Sphingomonadaceae bacterium]MCP5394280.1 GxxExxY protein [Sphingomonadaceae bacterium]